jgi:type IV/VI secretion system ImpK/VasF family protein
MRSTTALWFDIEVTFAELVTLCDEARAAELVVSRRDEEKRLFRNMRGGGGGSDASSPASNPSSRHARAVELSKDLAFSEAHPNGADLVELRSVLRKRLTWLKAKLGEVLSEHEVYYTLFPIVVYADELVNAVAPGALRWEPLQSELYEIDNGGEVFYSILDARLRQEETHPLVFEVFYYCLSDGFLGVHQSDPRKIDEYKVRLVERIRPKPVEPDAGARKEAAPVVLVGLPWRYHAVAAGAVLGTYLLFTWFGWMSN